MSHSLLLLLDMTRPKPFDPDRILDVITHLPGAQHCRVGDEITFTDYLFLDCEYSDGRDSTSITVPENLVSVGIHGIRDVSFDAAIAIQRGYGGTVYAIDGADCSLHVDLSQVSSVEQLLQALDL